MILTEATANTLVNYSPIGTLSAEVGAVKNLDLRSQPYLESNPVMHHLTIFSSKISHKELLKQKNKSHQKNKNKQEPLSPMS